jgi:hypothetical protein
LESRANFFNKTSVLVSARPIHKLEPSMGEKLKPISWKKFISILIFSATVLALLAAFIPSRLFPDGGDFRNNLWGPAYLLVHHHSPYDIKILFGSVNAIWMPVIIGLFFPIGYLPLNWASNLFILLNLCALFLMAFLLTRTSTKSKVRWLLAVVAMIFFPATISQFVMGQVSLLICLDFLLLVMYFDRLNIMGIGALLAFSLTKPQLAILFMPAFLILYYREFGYRKLVQVIVVTVAWILIFCLPLFLFHPDWLPDFIANLRGNSQWQYPTLYAFILDGSASRTTALVLAGIYVFIGVGLVGYLTFKRRRTEALLWSLALTPLFSPIIWSWDFVLLLPLAVYLAGVQKSKVSSWVLYGGYGLCTVLFIWLRTGINSDHLSFWLPPVMNAVMYYSDTRREKSAVLT